MLYTSKKSDNVMLHTVLAPNLMFYLFKGIISFTLEKPGGSTMSTDANIQWDMGDGNSFTSPQQLNITSLPFQFIQDYTYAQAGDFTITVKVFNLASSRTFTVSASLQICIYLLITNSC